MNEVNSHIPTEVYLGILGRTIQIHWNLHAILMVCVWVVMVPACILSIRYFKPRPSTYGIRERVGLRNLRWWWFSVHKFGLYTAIFLALGGLATALIVSRGFSGSTHSMFGLATITMGCLQVVSAQLRGPHGGRYYYTADPDDPATWAGDHFSMTRRRRMFEAYHKTSGYFTGFLAVGAVGSGLMQYRMPVLMGFVLVMAFAILTAFILLEFKGRRYDGYRAVFGINPEHPFNKARRDL